MGDDRAETYLRLLAETELRRVLRLLGQAERRSDGGSDRAGGLLPDSAFRPGSDIARSAAQVSWAGDVLVAAGVLANDRVSRIVAELDAALTARARSDSSRRATSPPCAGASVRGDTGSPRPRPRTFPARGPAS